MSFSCVLMLRTTVAFRVTHDELLRPASGGSTIKFVVTDMPEPADTELLDTLRRRDGVLTTVYLKDGSSHIVKDIAWGYDFGDEFAHITTNIIPGDEGLSIDFFHSDAVIGISDTSSGDTIAVALGSNE